MLAGALSNVELGDEIPAELYKAVAEVLIFVLRLSGRRLAVIVSPRWRLHRRGHLHRVNGRSPVINRRPCARSSCRSRLLPSRAFANVSPPRSEIREGLAKRFTDLGTAGTFVGYKVDDYLIIASDKERSGEAKLPASTFKIPNSLIALETGVVADPDKDVFKWDGVKRSIEAWNKDHTMRIGDRGLRGAGLSGDRAPHRAGADAEICRSVRLRQPRHRRRHRPVLADRRLAHRSGRSRSISSTGCGAACCRSPSAARIWCATSCR